MITGIKCDAVCGTPGEPIRVIAEGTLPPSHELRYYLASAPAASKLLTLETYQGERKRRADLRLTKRPDGSAFFTPDVPGVYRVAVCDVTLSLAVPHFEGQVLPPDSDNELTTAPTYTALVYVAEERRRTLGQQPDTASLIVRGFNNVLLPRPGLAPVDTAVALVPASSALAKQAAAADDVLSALSAARQATNVAAQFDLSWAEITESIGRWNDHLTAPPPHIHGYTDSTNVVSLPEATILAGAMVLLNEIKAKYAAHRVDVSLHEDTYRVHAVADTTNVVTAPNATNLATALTLWLDLRDTLWAHMVNTTAHAGGGAGPVDGRAYAWIEPPINEASLIVKTNQLRALYRHHLTMVAPGVPHANDDTHNWLDPSLDTQAGVIATANRWSEAIRRHAGNLDASGVHLGDSAAYHKAIGRAFNRDIMLGSAGDIAGAMRLIERCILAAEEHMTDAPDESLTLRPHASPTWGAWGFRMAERYGLRLQRAWLAAARLDAPPPSGANVGFASLVSKGWT